MIGDPSVIALPDLTTHFLVNVILWCQTVKLSTTFYSKLIDALPRAQSLTVIMIGTFYQIH